MLFNAFTPVDEVTGTPRGYFVVSAGQRQSLTFTRLMVDEDSWSSLANLFCTVLPDKFAVSRTLEETVLTALTHIRRECLTIISFQGSAIDLAGSGLQEEFVTELKAFLRRVSAHPLYAIVLRVMSAWPSHQEPRRAIFLPEVEQALNSLGVDGEVALATLFLLSSPLEMYNKLRSSVLSEWLQLREPSMLSGSMKQEVDRIAQQMSYLNDFCSCGKERCAFLPVPG